ncbi:50S ribosomal protein L18 [Nymphaea thermarum]|nr:50S ribosomal protein L18 [Nymphaea thermarum]
MAVSLSLSSSLSFLTSVRSSSLSSRTALTANFGSKNARFLKIEANARTRTEDRVARHERIRKKLSVFLNARLLFALNLTAIWWDRFQFWRQISAVLVSLLTFLCSLHKVHGTPERPRLCVYRSNKHLFVQVIDDTKMHTLASASTMQKSLVEEIQYTSGPTIEVAKRVGEAIAKVCLDKGITRVAFDRGGYLYHGRVKALADSAREHGLDF